MGFLLHNKPHKNHDCALLTTQRWIKKGERTLSRKKLYFFRLHSKSSYAFSKHPPPHPPKPMGYWTLYKDIKNKGARPIMKLTNSLRSIMSDGLKHHDNTMPAALKRFTFMGFTAVRAAAREKGHCIKMWNDWQPMRAPQIHSEIFGLIQCLEFRSLADTVVPKPRKYIKWSLYIQFWDNNNSRRR